MTTLVLGDAPLSPECVLRVAAGATVELAPEIEDQLITARRLVEHCAQQATPFYGISTGFGALAEVKIPPDRVAELQRNLVLSHSAGVGQPLSRAATRAMMLLRAQTLTLGCSGVRPCVLDQLVAMLNHDVLPIIPEKGSVGASGDLAPLAHIALAMIGEGEVYFDGVKQPARAALERCGLEPLVLEAKEGLALVNGTQGMAALGSLMLLEAEALCRLSDIAGTMSLEGLRGLPAAFDERIHAARPHAGQVDSARNVRQLLKGSALHSHHAARTQDPYSLRCMPQVHGASRDALAYLRKTLTCEINSVTDNPLVFADDEFIVSGGNFHGQPLALALDFAALAVAELGNISERRAEQLLNPALSGLPPFLVPESGMHSGYMMAQVTAASLVNENKVLATPASTDSIPGSACREDHVSMGMTSARKLREVVANTRSILAVELLCATQAIDLAKPSRLGAGAQAAHGAVRQVVPFLDRDRLLATDLAQMVALCAEGTILDAVQAATGPLL